MTEREDLSMKSLWCRVGFTITITDEEYKILCQETEEAAKMLIGIIRNPDKSKIDGETYFPEEAQYEECELGSFELYEWLNNTIKRGE